MDRRLRHAPLPPGPPARARGHRAARRRATRGLSLIELMVAMVIGLLAVIVISQVMMSFEGQRRTTTSGADAQLTGTLALYTLQRELQMAGYGMAANPAGLGCTIRSSKYAAAGGNRQLVPVIITDGASGAPDTLRVFASSKPSFSVPIRVTNNHPLAGAGSTEFAVSNRLGVDAGDLMVAVPPAPDAANTCLAFRVNGTGTPTTVPHAAGGANDPNGWNNSLLFPAAGYPVDSYLVNLGPGLIDRTYSVVSGNLRRTEYHPGTLAVTTSDPFPQVVSLQAFYGKDTNADGTVDEYNTTTPTTPAGWAQVIALRVAVVVRSDQFEKEAVTTGPVVWDLGASPLVTGTGVSTCGSSRCLSIPVNTDITNTNWQRYRYRLYDTVIPLRNVVWHT